MIYNFICIVLYYRCLGGSNHPAYVLTLPYYELFPCVVL